MRVPTQPYKNILNMYLYRLRARVGDKFKRKDIYIREAVTNMRMEKEGMMMVDGMDARVAHTVSVVVQPQACTEPWNLKATFYGDTGYLRVVH